MVHYRQDKGEEWRAAQRQTCPECGRKTVYVEVNGEAYCDPDLGGCDSAWDREAGMENFVPPTTR